MNRRFLVLALTGLAAVFAASCRSSPSEQRLRELEQGANIKKTLVGYHTIVSAHKGKVGYLKVYDVTEGGGPAYPWKYVYDADWRELGYITQFGTATMYHRYSPSEQAFQKRELRGSVLPSDSPERNVMRMLEIDPSTDDVTFPAASQADITGDTAPHLAGPGVMSGKAPMDAEKPAAK